MDKSNYNVDDILSEIKSRKSRSKSNAHIPESKEPPPVNRPLTEAGSAPDIPRHPPQPRPVFQEPGFERTAPPVQRRPTPEQPPRQQRPPLPVSPPPRVREQAARPEAFKVTLPEDKPDKKKNPLEFGAPVRSINERAKFRGAEGGTRQIPKFDFNAGRHEVTEDTGRTRVLPHMGGMRSIETSDIRKIDFVKVAKQADSYYESPEDDMPEGSAADFSEYNSASDRHDVQTDIARARLWLFIRITVTLLLSVFLFLLTLWGRYEGVPFLPKALEPVPETMRAYLLACTAASILIAFVNSSAVGGGLIGLFRMHANSDTLPAFALLAAVGQGVTCAANPEIAEPQRLNLYFMIAALIMLFNGLGKILMINRIMKNFKTISSDVPKKALLTVRSDNFCREFFKNETRRPIIGYCAKSGFFTDFLGLSYSDRYDVGMNRVVAPVCILASASVGVLAYFLSGGAFSAMSSVTAVLCVCATLSSTFIENIPLSVIAKKLAPVGGMVSGIKAVDSFSASKALILTENDLFPAGNVRLHGIKAFSQRIDEAILDAASVLCAMDGALGHVFLDIIGGNRKLLKRVDNIVFENDMGISAWIDQRRVLIGNRKLMVNHGIELPPEVMQQKHGQIAVDSEPLFLSSSGEASAQFSVSYHIDEELALELDQLGALERLLIVYTTDANITAEKIWELYGYPLEFIRVLPAEMHADFQEMSKPRDKAVAEIACVGKASGIVRAVLSCISAKSSILTATGIQLGGIVLGYAFVTYMALMGTIGSLNFTAIIAYQLFCFIAVFITQKVRR